MRNSLVLSTLLISLLGGSALGDDAKPAPAPAQPAPARPAPARPAPTRPVKIKLADAKGKSMGTATLSVDPGGVKITLAVKGLTAGDHAIHIHEVAKCEGPDFKSAGAHFNPAHKKHGLDSPDGPHAGDIPNFTVDARGRSAASVVAPGITLDDGAHGVFAGGGTALVIHASPDDGKTDPAGAAGERIVCGVIKK
jgi:superoxide dismutase, Cu-Zn family